MIERRHGSRLLFETAQAAFISRELAWEKFYGHFAAKTRIGCAPADQLWQCGSDCHSAQLGSGPAAGSALEFLSSVPMLRTAFWAAGRLAASYD